MVEKFPKKKFILKSGAKNYWRQNKKNQSYQERASRVKQIMQRIRDTKFFLNFFYWKGKLSTNRDILSKTQCLMNCQWNPSPDLDLWKELSSGGGGSILTKITKSSFLTKAPQNSILGSSKSLLMGIYGRACCWGEEFFD